MLVAELIGVSPDPVRHQVVLNKGERDGVFVGQPLIDADGLMGQVVEVSALTSRVLLITDCDPLHPGSESTAMGCAPLLRDWCAGDAGDQSRLSDHRYQEGDLLVTSGLGGRFPVGYPVAEVAVVERDPGQAVCPDCGVAQRRAGSQPPRIAGFYCRPGAGERLMADEGPQAYWVILADFLVALVLAVLPLPQWLLWARPSGWHWR